MSQFPQSVCWRCSTCKVCGVVPMDEHTSILSLTGAIVRDHLEKSPKCPTGDKEIQILNEGKVA